MDDVFYSSRKIAQAPRESVVWFANQMEAKLKTKDAQHGTEGWTGEHLRKLACRIVDEWDELIAKINEGSPTDIIEECADVANFAMMIADNIKRETERELVVCDEED